MMKHVITILICFFTLSVCAQLRIRPDKRIRLAPDTSLAHALISDATGRYQHTGLKVWIQDNFDFSDSTIWRVAPTNIYYDGLTTIGGDGNGLSLSGRNLYVYGGARIDQLLDIEGATPLLNFRNLTDQTVATVEHLGGGDMQIRFINRLGLWNAPEESLDIPGTIKMRGIQSVAPTPTMKMVVMDSVDKVAQLIDLPIASNFQEQEIILPNYSGNQVSGLPSGSFDFKIYIGGLLQREGGDYFISGTDINFTWNIPSVNTFIYFKTIIQ